ncbi:MAG: phospholipase D-like domain-containing protein, partial [Mycobacteriaceae bacterium]
MPKELNAGAYEALHTRRLDAELVGSAFTPRFAAVSDAAAPEVLARHVATAVRHALTSTADDDQRRDRVNELLAVIGAELDSVVDLKQLIALTEHVAPGVDRIVPRPVTPLSDVALLTNSRGEPNLGAELSAEMASADSVDLLCAFILFTGVRVIKEQLEELHARGVRLRVITTTYRGATQRRAVDELVNTYGAQVKIRYETVSTRLHAKAWLFRRQSGFDTGYVGSSNLSRSAMLDGLEWNVRISSVATPTLIRKF